MLVKYAFVYSHVYRKNASLFICYNIILKSKIRKVVAVFLILFMYLCFNARENAERVIAVHGMFEKVVRLNTEESLCRSVLASSITRAGVW